METRMGYKTNRMILEELISEYSLSKEKAMDMYERIGLLFHGITTVIATTKMDYADEVILKMIRQTIEDACK
ncbi:MAG: hypothetical protein Q4D54_00215 [Eubacteriales bacterium]|nr:hypothetical protein [Eubacteriales bacterium]